MRSVHKKQKYCSKKCKYVARHENEKRAEKEREEKGLKDCPRINLTDSKVAEVSGVTAQTLANYKNSEKESVRNRYDVLRIGVLMKLLGYNFESLKIELEMNGGSEIMEQLAINNALYHSQIKEVRKVINDVKGKRSES